MNLALNFNIIESIWSKMFILTFSSWAELHRNFVPMAGKGDWAEPLLEFLINVLGRAGRKLNGEDPDHWIIFSALMVLIIGLGLLYTHIKKKSVDK